MIPHVIRVRGICPIPAPPQPPFQKTFNLRATCLSHPIFLDLFTIINLTLPASSSKWSFLKRFLHQYSLCVSYFSSPSFLILGVWLWWFDKMKFHILNAWVRFSIGCLNCFSSPFLLLHGFCSFNPGSKGSRSVKLAAQPRGADCNPLAVLTVKFCLPF